MNANEEEEKNQEDETRKKRVGHDDTRKTNSKREEDGSKKKVVGESDMLRNLESLVLKKPTESEMRENSVWLRLVRTNKLSGEDREDGLSSRANLENVKSQTQRGMRLAERTVTDLLSPTCISEHCTDDVMRQNDGDKGKANHAGNERTESGRERITKPHTRGHAESSQYQCKQC